MAGGLGAPVWPRSSLTNMLDEWSQFLMRVAWSTLNALFQLLTHKDPSAAACRLGCFIEKRCSSVHLKLRLTHQQLEEEELSFSQHAISQRRTVSDEEARMQRWLASWTTNSRHYDQPATGLVAPKGRKQQLTSVHLKVRFGDIVI